MLFNPTKIVVHHDGVSRKGPSFAIINTYHQSQHFPKSSLGFYVGYHFWIERDGTPRQARTESEIGAHTQGENYTALGIGLAGNFDEERPSDEQIVTLGALLSHLCFAHSIPSDRISPHRHYAKKTCYGSLLPDTWAQGIFLQFEQTRIAAAMAELGVGFVPTIKKKASGLALGLAKLMGKV